MDMTLSKHWDRGAWLAPVLVSAESAVIQQLNKQFFTVGPVLGLLSKVVGSAASLALVCWIPPASPPSLQFYKIASG